MGVSVSCWDRGGISSGVNREVASSFSRASDMRAKSSLDFLVLFIILSISLKRRSVSASSKESSVAAIEISAAASEVRTVAV